MHVRSPAAETGRCADTPPKTWRVFTFLRRYDQLEAKSRLSSTKLTIDLNSPVANHDGEMRQPFASLSNALFSWKPGRVTPLINHFRRKSSHAAPTPKFFENIVNVPVGSRDQVSLSILRPVTTSVPQPGNVILYLPPGPIFEHAKTKRGNSDHLSQSNGDFPCTPQQVIASTTLSTVVTIKYRLGRERVDGKQIYHKFPSPVHETLTGLDWIIKELKPNHLCVFGTHIGGSLALMLALTESQSIAAVAADRPICDWAGLDDYCTVGPETKSRTGKRQPHKGGNDGSEDSNSRKRGRKKKPAPQDLVPLLETRRALFRQPQKYFDPFASPTLFLRSPGKYCPLTFPAYYTGPEYPVPVLKRVPKSEEEDLYFLDIISPPAKNIDMLPEETEPASSLMMLKPVRRRKALSRWPPHGLDYGLHPPSPHSREGPEPKKLVLPNVRIYSHGNVSDTTNKPSETTAATSPEDEQDSISNKLEAMNIQDEDTNEGCGDTASNATRPRSLPKGSSGNMAQTHGDTVLAQQATEIVSLMHSACFWGHEKGFGEERVKLIQIPPHTTTAGTAVSRTHTDPETNHDETSLKDHGCGGPDEELSNPPSVEEQAGRWFQSIFKTEDNN